MKISKNVSLVAMFCLMLSVSTQMLYSQMPLFLKLHIKIDEMQIACIDGCVEFISYLVRIFSGAVADYCQNKKTMMIVGAMLSGMSKFFIGQAMNLSQVLCAQIVERVSGGIQAPARDAVVADISDQRMYGRSFGIMKISKTLGALIGAALSVLIMTTYCGRYDTLFFFSAIPAFLSILFLLWIKDVAMELKICRAKNIKKNIKNITAFCIKNIKLFDKKFWYLLLIAFICEMGYFSEALISIRASEFINKNFVGMTVATTAVGQLLFSYYCGKQIDCCFQKNIHEFYVLLCIIMLTIVANIVFLAANSIYMIFIGAFLICGQHTASQIVFLSSIAKATEEDARATAIGLFYASVGLAYMVSSVIAGYAWSEYSCTYAYLYSLLMCSVSLICITAFLKHCAKPIIK